MTTTSTTTAADGSVVSTTDTTPVVTFQFSSKRGLPNYSNEECGIFVQVPLTEGTTPEQIEKQLDEQAAFAKAYVYKQLGVAAEVAANGVVVGEIPVEQPKSTGKRGGKASKAAPANVQTTDEEKADLWAQLAGAFTNGDNFKVQTDDGKGETIWDNRKSKRSPNGPDFKWADSGKALWLSDAPEWFAGPGQGITV